MQFILFKKGDRRKFQTKEWQTSPERQCCHCLEFHRSWLPGISTIYDNPSHVSPQTQSSAVQICWKYKKQIQKTIHHASHQVLFEFVAKTLRKVAHPTKLGKQVLKMIPTQTKNIFYIRCKKSTKLSWWLMIRSQQRVVGLHPFATLLHIQNAFKISIASCATSRLKLLCIALDGYFIRLHNSECGFESLR